MYDWSFCFRKIDLKRLKPVVCLFVIFLSFLASTGCYTVKQGWRFQKLYRSRRPVKEVVADKKTPSEVRKKLELMREILLFANKEGLLVEDAYETYIDTQGKPVSYLVHAAYPDHLELVTWWFPIVGSMPYLGFFEKKERDEEAEDLRKEGYDVSRGVALAFSSLGWFDDPVFSKMVSYSDLDLIHTIFHELTHRTLWWPSSVKFNENLAEFVGEKLTVKFLKASGREEYLELYLDNRSDRMLFITWLSSLKEELKVFYSRVKKRDDSIAFAAGKKGIFQKYRKDLLPEFKTEDYAFVGRKNWNNASILTASMYGLKYQVFEKAYLCVKTRRKMADFLDSLEKAKEDCSCDDAFKVLDYLCK